VSVSVRRTDVTDLRDVIRMKIACFHL